MTMSKHTDPTPIRFFKIVPGTSLQEGKLRIPKKFIRKYGGDMSNPMFLKPPDGTKWEVLWTKHDGDIWLQKGWIEFATYYSLDHGHMVLFEYKQTCNFEVHIFDMSTLEIDYPLHVSQDAQDNLDTTSDDDSIQILDEVQPSHKTRQKSPMPSPQPRKKSRTGTSGGVERRSTEQNVPHHVQTESTNFEKSKFASVKKESDGYPLRGTQYEQSPVAGPQSRNKLRNSTRGVQSQGTNFDKSKIAAAKKELDEDVDGTSPNTNGALKEADKFASENPFFTFKVRPGIQSRPLISVAFVREYFENKTQIVKLRCGKKVWPIKFLCYPHNSAAFFSGGWFQFARECKLVVGDVCVFELINREDAVFDVHIFRRHT